jgi:hypothetical protein
MSDHKTQPTSPDNQPKASPLSRKQVPCSIGETDEATALNYAKLILSPEMASFRVITNREREELMAQLDTPSLLDALREQTQTVHQGDMKVAEAMLISQATALQSLFVKLTETGLKTGMLRQQEPALRLALKAQSQCRATLETLSNIKNPPIVYAKQANVTTGPQQVNNNLSMPRSDADAGAPQKKTRKNKLKEIAHEQEQWLDAGTPGTTGSAHPRAKAMVAIDRPTNRGRKGQSGA